MKTKQSLSFQAQAGIGKGLIETFYRRTGRRLGAEVKKFKGEVDLEWSAIETGKKETLVMLHGFSDRRESFYFAAGSLKKRFNLILPDLPGFGKSTLDQSLEYSLENYGRWLGEFIEKACPESFHLAGSSMGGAVAATLAAGFPDRIKSLCLENSAGFYLPGRVSIHEEALDGINIFQIDSAEEYERLRDRIFKKKPALPRFVREYMIKQAMDNKEWYGKIFNDLMDMESVHKGLASMEEISLNSLCLEIQMPTLLIWGRHDTLFPWETASFLENRIPDARVHIFENLGHAPHLEDPSGFAGVVSDFISGLE
ncbi:alpha/beta fold hydrolase [Desulfospira joergensenii]|uniref:alpha/beta fold hydrolase n=1 Tax=Desulfospira joergensenii TaxID=53329 RepID=UPI0003B2FD87|nr:alpha/beta hydrolase [Desulfospira joergensenii]